MISQIGLKKLNYRLNIKSNHPNRFSNAVDQ